MEEWKQSEEFPSYDISDEGKVRNRKTGRILKTNISEKGYERVSLSENGVSKTRSIHTLVAETYIPDYEVGMGVIHKDNNPLNNHADNLELGTKSDIARSSYDRGRKQTHRMRPVRCVETGEAFESITDCAKKMGVSAHGVSRSVNNPASRTKEGYHFKSLNN